MAAETLDLTRSVYELCTTYPKVKEVMAQVGFDEITKPGRLQTMGRLMTIPKGCQAKGIALADVVAALQEAGFVVQGFEAPSHDAATPAPDAAAASPDDAAASPDAAPADAPATTPAERRALLKSYLERLSAGEDVEAVRADFTRTFEGVDASEIASAEQALIAGGVAVEKVQQLCDVHASLFDGAVSCSPAKGAPEAQPGHPVQVMRAENAEVTKAVAQARALVAAIRALADGSAHPEFASALESDIDLLSQVLPHYKRKEELLFPHLEAHDVTGPSKVMWGKDDEVRGFLKMARSLLRDAAASPTPGNLGSVADQVEDAAAGMESMVTKEENVLIPLALENLTATEWTQVAAESDEFGYSYIEEPPAWKADALALAEDRLNALAVGKKKDATDSGATPDSPTVPEGGKVRLSTGEFTIDQLEAIFNTIPLDLTFVDADDKTRFFSHGDTRVFPRPKSCLGRDVYACHPPKSQAMVHQVFDDFRSGARDSYEFWIHLHGRFVYIRYFAVRDADGTYLGALETTQDITEISKLEGDNRRGADVRREARKMGKEG